MSDSGKDELQSVIDGFRKLLRECEDLYRSSAMECVQRHPELIKQAPDDFVDRMMDLHRGLLIKVFVEIAHIDWKWKPSERLLARELFEHVWGKRSAHGLYGQPRHWQEHRGTPDRPHSRRHGNLNERALD